MASRKQMLQDLKEIRSLERYEVIEAIEQLEKPRDKAFLAFLFLTGCRIEEVVPYIQDAKPNRTLLKRIEGFQLKTRIHSPLERKLLGFPILKKQIEVYKDRLIVRGVRCLKRRDKQGKQVRRSIPIILNKQEMPFIKVFMNYYRVLHSEDALFPFTRAWGYLMLDKIGLFPHLLRHTRATLLATEYDFTEVQLQRFFGWKDTRQAPLYTHLNVKDIINKLRKANNG